MARRDHGIGDRVRPRPRAQLNKHFAAAALLAVLAAAGCSSTSQPVPAPSTSARLPGGNVSLADFAIQLAKLDRQPPRKAVYLTPLVKLSRECRGSSASSVDGTVGALALALRKLGSLGAPAAAAEAVLASDVQRQADCPALADALRRELTVRLKSSGNLYSGAVRFAPPVTADLALASIVHFLLPGKVHVVYALKAFSCQQAIFMGPGLARKYGNPDLGAFVELTSGQGVGHGKYDANQVDRARITPFGRVGGQPCT